MSYHTEIITPTERSARCAKHDWAHLLPYAHQLPEARQMEYVAANTFRYAHRAYICLGCGKTSFLIYGKKFRINPADFSAALKLEAKNLAIRFGLAEKEPGVYTV
mgnify:CR=1 FL=1